MAKVRRFLACALWAAGFLTVCGLCGFALGALPWQATVLRAALFFQAPTVALALPDVPAAPVVANRPGGNRWWQQGTQRPTPAPVLTPAPTAPATPPPTPAPTPTLTPTEAPSPTSTPLPGTAPALKDAGRIRAEQYAQGSGEGFVTLSAGSIQNRTRENDGTLRAATEGALPFTVEPNSAEPQLLIVHTHATESYQTWPDPVYEKSFTARSDNNALNMCAVGAEMARVLNAAGINTLHDETQHDNPGYTESYQRSAATVERYLEQYPSIKVVLDVHRDAIEDGDGTRVKPLSRINGEDTAQVMIIAGCDNGNTAPLPNWRLNLRFAAAWETAMEKSYPGLTRPVLCAYRYYNQDLTTGSLLIEIGGHANTLAEAKRAGVYAADALAAVLLGSG